MKERLGYLVLSEELGQFSFRFKKSKITSGPILPKSKWITSAATNVKPTYKDFREISL